MYLVRQGCGTDIPVLVCIYDYEKFVIVQIAI